MSDDFFEKTTGIPWEREVFIKELKEKINQAFENRIKVKSVNLGEKSETNEDVVNAQKDLAKRIKAQVKEDLSLEQTIVELGEYNEFPFRVSVDNLRDYKDLLYWSYRRFFPESVWPDEQAIPFVNKIFVHEFKHAIPGIFEENMKINYAVDFLELENGEPRIQPMIALSGKTNLKIFRNMVEGPENESSADTILKTELGDYK